LGPDVYLKILYFDSKDEILSENWVSEDLKMGGLYAIIEEMRN